MCVAVPKCCPGGRPRALSAELSARSLWTLPLLQHLGIPCGVCRDPPTPGGMLSSARGQLCHCHLDLRLSSRGCYKETRLLHLSGVGNDALSRFVKRFETDGHKGLCEELAFVIATLERDDFLYLGKVVWAGLPSLPTRSLPVSSSAGWRGNFNRGGGSLLSILPPD